MIADTPLDVDEEELRAVDGRLPGRRGRETRRRLLMQTAEMLESHTYRELAVVEIARGAEVSPATFYQYFGDVESAVLLIAEHVAEQGARRLSDRVKQLAPVTSAELEPATALAQEALDIWNEARSVLRVVDLLASEGDQRFSNLRTGLLGPATEDLVDLIVARQQSGVMGADVDAKATAGSIMCMLAHVANHRAGLEAWAEGTDFATGMARIVVASLS